MMNINKITEQSNFKSEDIDKKDIIEITQIMNEEDRGVSESIKTVLPSISSFIRDVVISFNNQGRLIYIGSGTSGRLGVLDASECPPTFGVSKKMVVGIIAGGDLALKESIEGAEDDINQSVEQLKEIGFQKNDILLGISASGTTPYVLSALRYASKLGSKTGLLTSNNINSKKYIKHIIKIIVGPELISGSTRLKSGTATKMVLNMISTISMIKINKTFGNVMISMVPKNKKLIKRGIFILHDKLSLSFKNAESLFKESNYNLKIAFIMHKKSISYKKALKLSDSKVSIRELL